MVLQALQFKATLGNVEEFRVPEDHEWIIDLDQTGNPVKQGVQLCKKDVADIEGSKGVANLVLPSLKANITILDKTDKRVHEEDCEGTYCAEHSEQWKTMCVLECRGVECSKWTPTGGYKVTSAGEQRKVWDSANVNPEQEFNDVDEAEEPQPVTIYDIETRIITYTPKK